MKTIEVHGVECEDCGSFVAVEQASDGTHKLETRYKCSECDSIYESKDEADECCKDDSASD